MPCLTHFPWKCFTGKAWLHPNMHAIPFYYTIYYISYKYYFQLLSGVFFFFFKKDDGIVYSFGIDLQYKFDMSIQSDTIAE